MHGFTRRKKLAVLSAIATLAIAGAAFAYWTGSGTGSGTGTVASGVSVTLTGTVADGLSPGTAADVSFTAANATGSPIYVTAVHLVSIAVDEEHPACVTADFTMSNVTENHLVPAGATAEALPSDGSLVYAYTDVSQDACKGATLTLTLSST